MAPEAAPGAVADGWDRDAMRRFVLLAAGRAVAQGLGIAWFLVAARLLGADDFGQVATGLAFFALFAGVGDLGATRGIARHVSADHRMLRDAYTRALGLRVAGGLGVALVVAGVVGLASVPVSGWVVLLAGLVATASGATELAYAALRAVGRVRVEFWLLLVERAAFLALGTAAVLAGGGPLVVLGTYLATNAVSAVVSGVAALRAQEGPVVAAGSLTDREARYTAAGFALVTVAPRVPSILVALLASASAVGSFAVAQRPIEAMTLFALSTAAPVLPIVRSRTTRDLVEDARRAAVSVTGALLVGLAPVVAWFLATPRSALDLLFGEGRFDDAAAPLRILSVTALTWALRGVGEFVLLAQERARTLFRVTAVGTALTVAVGIPAVLAHEELGAAVAVASAELVMTLLLARVVPSLFALAAVRTYATSVAVVVGTAAAVLAVPDDPRLRGLVVALVSVPAVLEAYRRIRGLERAS